MLLKELHIEWKQDNTFTNRLGLIEYQCKVKYLPFGLANKVDYEKKDLSKINTPVFHLEFEALSTDESIYQSHWIIPYSLAWFLENYPDSDFEELVRFAAKENAIISFSERTVTGSSRLKRLKYNSSINSGNGAFHVSCLWLSIFPNLSGFSPSSRAI